MIDTNKILEKIKEISILAGKMLLIENDADKCFLLAAHIASLSAHTATLEVLTEIRDILKKESK